MTVRIQTKPFDMGAELNAFSQGLEAGAVVSFSGLVRNSGGMVAMEIEHYPAMTERAIAVIVAEATDRWSLERALVIHRHGRLVPGDPIMMVATASRHRVGAFQGAEFLMDFLKSRAPFWKKEIGADGSEWVAAKTSDEDALTRW